MRSKVLIAAFLFLHLVMTPPAMAAEVRVEVPDESTSPGSIVSVHVSLRSVGQPINAFEGVLSIPTGIQLESISYPGSLPVNWIGKPSVVGGRVVFSGIIPGGFEGVLDPLAQGLEFGRIFTVNLRTSTLGTYELSPQIIEAYANTDDHEPVVFVTMTDTVVVEGVALSSSVITSATDDIMPPETFSIVLTRDDRIWDGRNFIVFQTSDAGSGIYFYTVTEGTREPVTSGSPYLLEDQSLRSDITVRAYDLAGNIRVARLASTRNPWEKVIPLSLFILVAVAVVGCIIVFVRRRREV